MIPIGFFLVVAGGMLASGQDWISALTMGAIAAAVVALINSVVDQ